MYTISTTLMRLASLALVSGLVLALPVQAAASSGDGARKVNGEVVAVNTFDTPNTIVLRTMTGKNRELIVGATVDPTVDITRGAQPVGLSDIQIGEKVMLSYIKTADGLVARTIKAR